MSFERLISCSSLFFVLHRTGEGYCDGFARVRLWVSHHRPLRGALWLSKVKICSLHKGVFSLLSFLKGFASNSFEWKDMVPNKGRALILLRVSNELLRRLSNSRHTVFCGKIRIFLANSFPLCDRSGLEKPTFFHFVLIVTISFFSGAQRGESDWCL